MDGKSYTGEHRRPQCDPDKYGQCPARMLSQVAQTEPDKKFKEEEYVLHALFRYRSVFQVDFNGSQRVCQGAVGRYDHRSLPFTVQLRQ